MWHYTITPLLHCGVYTKLNNHFIFHHKKRRMYTICATKRLKWLTVQQYKQAEAQQQKLCVCVCMMSKISLE